MFSTLLPILLCANSTVSLQLVDDSGRPVPNRTIWLYPTNSTKSVRTFGHLWFKPNNEDCKHGITDSKGRVTIRGVPARTPMMVITTFGDRFKEKTSKGSPDGAGIRFMKFDGAVYAGKPARIVLSLKNTVEGTVTDFETGLPRVGVKVSLNDTGFGHMGGYPLTELDSCFTDATGRYRFTDLPRCAYTVLLGSTPASTAIESRLEGEDWQYVSVKGEDNAYESYVERGVQMKGPHLKFDFQLSRAAAIKVIIRKGTEPSLRDWWLAIKEVRKDEDWNSFGTALDYRAPNDPPKPIKDVEILSYPLKKGTYQLLIENQHSEKSYLAKQFKIGPGEKQTFDITLSTVLKCSPIPQ